jgi:hypothetical protein
VCAALDEFLRFRYVVRNIYAFHLDSDRASQLARGARKVVDWLILELEVFSAVIKRIGAE